VSEPSSGGPASVTAAGLPRREKSGDREIPISGGSLFPRDRCRRATGRARSRPRAWAEADPARLHRPPRRMVSVDPDSRGAGTREKTRKSLPGSVTRGRRRHSAWGAWEASRLAWARQARLLTAGCPPPPRWRPPSPRRPPRRGSSRSPAAGAPTVHPALGGDRPDHETPLALAAAPTPSRPVPRVAHPPFFPDSRKRQRMITERRSRPMRRA